MIKKAILGASIAALLAAMPGVASAADAKPEMKKLGGALNLIYNNNQTAAAAKRSVQPTQLMQERPDWSGEGEALGLQSVQAKSGPAELFIGTVTADGYVVMDAVAANRTEDLAAAMEAMGARNVSSMGRIVSAQFPVDRLGDLASSVSLAFARPMLASTNVGLVTSQGDRGMRTDTVRQRYGFDGSGMTIGVLSDSFDTRPGAITTTAQDIASNDLPPNVTILSDFGGGTDEGRGMAQLIHDVAPGAGIAFHTAFNGQADFANGIVELALFGSDVIVDDVIYFTEPMFQDGIIAQAADEVFRLGVPYYSSNGNRGRDAYEAHYRPVAFDGSTFHDFDEGNGVDPLMTVQLNGALQTNLSFQWDSPNFSVSGGAGAQNDVDVIMFDMQGNRVADCFPGGGGLVVPANGLCQFIFTDGGVPIDGGGGGDAIEFVSLVDFIGGQQVQLGFETQSGEAPGFVKFVIASGGFLSSEYPINAPSGYGHNNAAGAEGVGASAFFFNEEFIGDPATLQVRALAGEPECIPACLNDFSSAGGTPIFFDIQGNRLKKPEVRLKPGLTGPDGGNTTFFGNDTSRDDDDGDGVFQTGEPGEFPNFFGTSAAAPNAAALATLMLDAEGSEIVTFKQGQKKLWMCTPRNPNRKGRYDRNLRKKGLTVLVSPADVQSYVDRGALLGTCKRREPIEVYESMRETAQDMSVRAVLNTGATIQIFDEIGKDGFDFDSGYGFIDGVEAMRHFLNDKKNYKD